MVHKIKPETPEEVTIGDVEDSKKKEVRETDTKEINSSTKKGHTIFIHKLYNMLEDVSIQHLIWWSNSQHSFFLVPSEEFCKVLLSYFKHSNVASFVRQLNMYGFHKVNDSDKDRKERKSGNKEEVSTTRWEFFHSSKNFRKGDLDGLKSIKRRSSKNPNGNVKEYKYTKAEPILESKEMKEEDNNSVASSAAEQAPQLQPHQLLINEMYDDYSVSLMSLRNEHQRLLMRYEYAMDDLKRTNLDMVRLLDIVQKVAKKEDDTRGNLEVELNSFRSLIIQRISSRTNGVQDRSYAGPHRDSSSRVDSVSSINTSSTSYPFKYVAQRPPSSPQTSHYSGKYQLTKFPNPFVYDTYNSSNSSSRSRTMSILCDSLAPEPGYSTTPPLNSPSSENKHMMSPDMRQSGYFSSISSVRTSESNINPYQVYGVDHYEKRDYEEMNRKRHSSNDVLFDRSRKSDSSNSQLTLTFVNAPRSVPDLSNVPGAKGMRTTSTISQLNDRKLSLQQLPGANNLLAQTSSGIPQHMTGNHLNLQLPSQTAHWNKSLNHLSLLAGQPSQFSLSQAIKTKLPGSQPDSKPGSQPGTPSGVYSLLNHDKGTNEVKFRSSFEFSDRLGIEDREAKRLKKY